MRPTPSPRLQVAAYKEMELFQLRLAWLKWSSEDIEAQQGQDIWDNYRAAIRYVGKQGRRSRLRRRSLPDVRPRGSVPLEDSEQAAASPGLQDELEACQMDAVRGIAYVERSVCVMAGSTGGDREASLAGWQQRQAFTTAQGQHRPAGAGTACCSRGTKSDHKPGSRQGAWCQG